MTDAEAASEAARGLFLILGAVTSIPAGVAIGVGVIAQVCGYFFGDKHKEGKKNG